MNFKLAKSIGGPNPLDAFLTVNLVKNLNKPLKILEVGVFTGGFIFFIFATMKN